VFPDTLNGYDLVLVTLEGPVGPEEHVFAYGVETALLENLTELKVLIAFKNGPGHILSTRRLGDRRLFVLYAQRHQTLSRERIQGTKAGCLVY